MQLAYTKVPVEIASIIELTKMLEPVRPSPIATPVDKEIAKANINPVAFPHENPDRTKFAPRETEATK